MRLAIGHICFQAIDQDNKELAAQGCVGVRRLRKIELRLQALSELGLGKGPGLPSHSQPLPVAHAEIHVASLVASHVADAEADTHDDGVAVDNSRPVDGKLLSVVETADGQAKVKW